tara:strand:- start:6501 stop:7247 length:747 start_codon:yes stop_codon:yes gene_type:complete
LLTGYDDLLRRKKSLFRKIATSFITLGVILIFVALILWLPLNEKTTGQTWSASEPYDGKMYMNLGNAKNWSLPDQFQPVYSEIDTTSFAIQAGETIGTIAPATSIIIPTVNLVSDIEPLELVNDVDQPYYASPKYVVGHLPTSANPGENGSVWLFGHLESPFTNEGAVFWDIPKIQSKLDNNINVNVILENSGKRFIYRVNSVSIVDESEFEVFDTAKATLHLVTCYPRLQYNKRMVVNAELVSAENL